MSKNANKTKANGEQNNDHQRSEREHTGLRTLDAHHSAREVFQACHVPYPGTDVLRAKEDLRARASSERAQSPNSGDGTTAAGDRRGERGVSL